MNMYCDEPMTIFEIKEVYYYSSVNIGVLKHVVTMLVLLIHYFILVNNLNHLGMAESENIIKEGKASILLGSNIFYNPVQEFNRDMSIVALTVLAEESKDYGFKRTMKRHHSEEGSEESPMVQDEPKLNGITVLEALSATGLRSVRYALEVPNIAKIYANDFSIRAVETMQRNIKENGVEHIIEATNHDAVWLMQKLKFENEPIHAIDLDPYGCPTRFLNAAVNCITEGGVLLITCTDMAVIAGNTPETCYLKYGCISLRSPACHEMALRIALQAVANHCGQIGKYIVPLISFSADFYIRVIVRVFSSQRTSKQTASNISLVYKCVGCETMTLHPLCKMYERPDGNMKFNLPEGPPVSSICEHCGSKHRIGGPIWTGKLYDEEFVNKMLKIAQRGELPTYKRLVGMLSLIKEELVDVPLYYTIDSLCRKLHCVSIPLVDFKCALLNAGYKVSQSHCKTNSIKTDAPANFIWDVLRHWVKKNPVSQKRLQQDKIASTILGKEPEFAVNFKFCKKAVPLSVAHGLLRYQPNPMPHWGPGGRSKSGILMSESCNEKKKRNQNKKQRLKNSSQENEVEEPTRNGNETNLTDDTHQTQST